MAGPLGADIHIGLPAAEHARAADFLWPEAGRRLGPDAGGFGHFGAGGSLGFCDPEAGIALGYVPNDMGPRWQNPRNRALIEAVYASL